MSRCESRAKQRASRVRARARWLADCAAAEAREVERARIAKRLTELAGSPRPEHLAEIDRIYAALATRST